MSWLAADPTRYRSSKDVERSFWPVCGSRIGFHRVHETSLAVGSFDAPEALPVADIRTSHVWFKEHVPWFDMADEWPRNSEFPSGRAEELNALSGASPRGTRQGAKMNPAEPQDAEIAEHHPIGIAPGAARRHPVRKAGCGKSARPV